MAAGPTALRSSASSADKAVVGGRVPGQPRAVPAAGLLLVAAVVRGVPPLLHPQAAQLGFHGGGRWDGARAQGLPRGLWVGGGGAVLWAC